MARRKRTDKQRLDDAKLAVAIHTEREQLLIYHPHLGCLEIDRWLAKKHFGHNNDETLNRWIKRNLPKRKMVQALLPHEDWDWDNLP
jgi:hypothetical protein